MNFREFVVETTASPIAGSMGGDGDPVLLLHGIPETHRMWRHVAPRLAERWTVVATDLRGFGASGTRGRADVDALFSMRELARDQVEAMGALGFDHFVVIGHDRGARCAYRLALDHPDCVTKLGVLDIVPTGDASTAPTRSSRSASGCGAFSPPLRPSPSSSSSARPTCS